MEYFTRNAAFKQTHINGTPAPAAANEEIWTSLLKSSEPSWQDAAIPCSAYSPCTIGHLQKAETAPLSCAGWAELGLRDEQEGSSQTVCCSFSMPLQNRWIRDP